MAEASVEMVGGDFGRNKTSENVGGAAGVVVRAGMIAFAVEFRISKIDAAAFGVVTGSLGAGVRPRLRVADRERERDRVPIGPRLLVPTSSLVAASPATIPLKSMG
jgi:hypothetical protein